MTRLYHPASCAKLCAMANPLSGVGSLSLRREDAPIAIGGHFASPYR